jgi:hypothetical protein
VNVIESVVNLLRRVEFPDGAAQIVMYVTKIIRLICYGDQYTSVIIMGLAFTRYWVAEWHAA